MKKHSFRLESYLKIKEFEEKMSWNEVLTQMGRVNAISQKINSLKDQQKNIRQKTSLFGQNVGPQLYELSLASESIEGTKARIEALIVEMRNEEKILERLRVKHIEAKKELRTIEKVKEKSLLNFKEEVEKRDSKITTEVAMQMHNRGKAENE